MLARGWSKKRGQQQRSRLGATLGMLRHGMTVPAGTGHAEPGLLTLPQDVPVFSYSDLALPEPSPGAGWPRSCGEALAAPWLVSARSSDGGGTGGSRCFPRFGGGGSDLHEACPPPGSLGLAAPSPGAGKLLCFCSSCFSSGWWEDGEPQWWGRKELPTERLLCFAKLCPILLF